jgi:uncharacterized membrane protein YfcA
MSILLFTTLIFLTSVFAGLLGSLTGLGGGVVIVPALVLLFKLDLRYAIGASLVSVIATRRERPRLKSRKVSRTSGLACSWR